MLYRCQSNIRSAAVRGVGRRRDGSDAEPPPGPASDALEMREAATVLLGRIVLIALLELILLIAPISLFALFALFALVALVALVLLVTPIALVDGLSFLSRRMLDR